MYCVFQHAFTAWLKGFMGLEGKTLRSYYKHRKMSSEGALKARLNQRLICLQILLPRLF